jgi:hypothetical protein
MTLYVKDAGVWKPTSKLHAKRGEAWLPVRRAFIRDGGVWKQNHQDEDVRAVSGNPGAFLISNQFPADVWANPIIRKRLVITPGTIVSGTSWGAIAIQDGNLSQSQSFSGELIIDNHGDIRGVGGQPNAGAGGTAFLANFAGRDGGKATLNNYGVLRGGGGAGGFGGKGGDGFYDTGYTAVEGPAYARESYDYDWLGNERRYRIHWAGQVLGYTTGDAFGHDGWTYYRGPLRETTNHGGSIGGYRNDHYEIRREAPASYRTYVTGAWGGNGGRGDGVDGGWAWGAGGGNSGGNTGQGGAGGRGGGWGEWGARGADGAWGNNGGPNAGQDGGPPGFYVQSIGNINFNNYGTVQGRAG